MVLLALLFLLLEKGGYVMSGFTISKIKLIYCYIVCFVCTIFIIFKGIYLSENRVKAFLFEDRYKPSEHLKKNNFMKNKKDQKDLSTEQIENLRQIAIEEEKYQEFRELKSTFYIGLPGIFYCLLILGIHIYLIRKTR
jgi:hypothetical protein